VSSLDFLSPASNGTAVARSPMERDAIKAGARIERRGAWNLAVEFDGTPIERERCAATVGFADLSHLGKAELRGPPDVPLELGTARHSNGAWWCPITRERTLVIGEANGRRERAVDMTTSYAALTIAGPLARELFARFCALDLRPEVTPVHAFRPGSVARTPGYVLCEDKDRYLMLFGAALGHYMWTVVADVAASLGGGPVGVDALAPITSEEPAVHA
jgi:glycine cleavage system aminomethyltransferase T